MLLYVVDVDIAPSLQITCNILKCYFWSAFILHFLVMAMASAAHVLTAYPFIAIYKKVLLLKLEQAVIVVWLEVTRKATLN